MFIIYISGIDGCGKTTQASLLVDNLRNSGVDAEYMWLRWDPSFRKVFVFLKSLVGKSKRKDSISKNRREQMQHNRWIILKKILLSNKIFRWIWWEYACRDYQSYLKKKFQELATVDVLIVDRYVHDFVIDQAVNLGISPDGQSALIEKLKTRGFRFPDLSIIINLPAQEGYIRKLDGTPLDYLNEREIRYHKISQGKKTLHLDGMNEIDSLSNSISNWVSKNMVNNQQKLVNKKIGMKLWSVIF